MKLDSRLFPTRRALPAASLLALLAAFACSSVDRTPATGSEPPPDLVTPPEASEAESASTADPSPSSSGGLTEDEILAIPPEVGSETDLLDIGAKSLEELNTEGHLKDVQFEYDSADLSPSMRATLEENAAWLSRYPSVSILVEGHCDERGTVEYNLALGEERARAVRDYLRDLGVGTGRMRIISYGKEFPLDPGHNETAWRRNRRAHLEIVAK
ncbi:MAG: peptidoglycan-associated lipoprotein Pal [Acidobacteriota bacterium]|nr:peptidoglycan-associated lipoprotein Pal [Acidobacteriota bacterium]MDE2710389.1 peptidoglycan-associated lipoprotein Pal [Acidobacteriota bacterium]MYF76687.1 peptidoglycan-associated lipoprotein Pal [Acidobacteriota bacterium]